METVKIIPDVRFFNSLIRIYARLTSCNETLSCLELMSKLDITKNYHTLDSVIYALVLHNRFEDIFVYVKAFYPTVVPNPGTFLYIFKELLRLPRGFENTNKNRQIRRNVLHAALEWTNFLAINPSFLSKIVSEAENSVAVIGKQHLALIKQKIDAWVPSSAAGSMPGDINSNDP